MGDQDDSRSHTEEEIEDAEDDEEPRHAVVVLAFRLQLEHPLSLQLDAGWEEEGESGDRDGGREIEDD